MTKKDQIQKEIENKILESGFRGIVESSVRSGKTRILLNCVKNQQWFKEPRVLVLYPNIDIKASWEKEQELINFFPNITYCTFVSIHTQLEKEYDMVIVDEAHLLGTDNQLPTCAEISKSVKHCILASGTYSNDTLSTISYVMGMKKIVHYPTEKAIEDGLVSDYKIFIHTYQLDDITRIEYGKAKKWTSTELKECNRITRKVMYANNDREKMFYALERMRFINNCNSLKNAVSKWISENQETRFIMFAADSKISNFYGLPVYNSLSKDDSTLTDFQEGKVNQLVLVRKARQGVTFPKLDTILITAIDSNSENLEQALGRGLLPDTDEAKIHIFVSNQDFQRKWLEKALTKIPKQKIIHEN